MMKNNYKQLILLTASTFVFGGVISSVQAVENVSAATTSVKNDKSIKKTKDGKGYIAEDDFKSPKTKKSVKKIDKSIKKTKDGKGYIAEDDFKDPKTKQNVKKTDKSIKKTKDGKGYIAEDDFKDPKAKHEASVDNSIKQTSDGGYIAEDTFK